MTESPNTSKSTPPSASPPGGKSVRQPRKAAAARLSVGANGLLVALKLLVGLLTGSVGVLSEALHSATDLLAASVAFLSVRASDTPPDEDHPYGHGKIESISGLVEALFILVAAAFIVMEAIARLKHPAGRTPDVGLGLAVMAFSALVTGTLSWHLMRVARATDSLALEADARHLRTDVITSLGVFTGLLLVRLTGWPLFDPLAALIVSLLITITAIKLGHDSLHPLLDARLPADEESAIHDILDAHPQVLGYHKLRTRKSGSQRHADVHVQMDDNSTLVEAHNLTEALEDQIRDALPAILINIHIEPFHAEQKHQQEAHGVASGLLDETGLHEKPRSALSPDMPARAQGEQEAPVTPTTGAR